MRHDSACMSSSMWLERKRERENKCAFSELYDIFCARSVTLWLLITSLKYRSAHPKIYISSYNHRKQWKLNEYMTMCLYDLRKDESRTIHFTAVGQVVACALVTQRARVRSPVGTGFLGEVFAGFFLTCKTNVGEALCPKVPEYHLAIIIIINHHSLGAPMSWDVDAL